MATINLRVTEEIKRRLGVFASAKGCQPKRSREEPVAEKLLVQEAADFEPAKVPSWVPDGKYVALVRGSVAAVGRSVAEVSPTAITKFPNDPIRVTRKGKRIKSVEYAFLGVDT